MRKALAPLVLAAVMVTGCSTQNKSTDGGKDLVVHAPQKVTIDRDATAELKVTIDRKGMDDPVKVEITNLPEGVSYEEVGKPDKTATERTFHLKARPDAPLATGKIKVKATGGGREQTTEVAYNVQERSSSGSSPVGKQAGEDLRKKREELNTTVQARTKDIDKAMGELREHAKTADAQAKIEINSRLKALEDQRQKLGEDLKNLPTTTAEGWQDFSARVTSAANELHRGANEAVKQFIKKK